MSVRPVLILKQSESALMDLALSVSGLLEAFSFSPTDHVDWLGDCEESIDRLVQFIVSENNSISDQPHMSLTPHVAQTYPLDSHLSIIKKLLPPQYPDSVHEEDIYPFEPQRAFQAPLPNISQETKEYLHLKGALSITPIELRNEVLGAYIKFVHPLLPIIDLQSFLLNVMVEDETQFASPLLYQAVMLAGSAFIKQETAIEAGFPSRKSLRRTLFERAKLLYEFETETDAHAQIQALLLMVQWHGSGVGHKDPIYWFDLAYSTAERIGLLVNLEPGSSSHMHRLWWCLFVRDRILSLGFRRPLRIPNSDTMMSLLESTESYYSEPYHDKVLAMLGDASGLLSCEGQEQMVLLFIQEIKLAHCVGVIMEHLYQDGWSLSQSGGSRYCLLPKRDVSQVAITGCEELLKTWIQHLPATAHYAPPSMPHNLYPESREMVILVHQAFLYLLHLTAMSILCQAESNGSNLRTSIISEMRGLTYQVIDTLNELHDHKMLRFLPGSSITILLIILKTSLLDLKAANQIVRMQAMLNLYACEEVAGHLLQTYPAAEIVLSQAQDARGHLLGLITT